jgi:predicted phosphodiesterase
MLMVFFMEISMIKRDLIVFLGTILLVVSFFASAASAAITKGPVLLRLDQNRAVVMFETDSKGAGSIDVKGTVASVGKFSTNIDVVDDIKGKDVYIHQASLTGLMAGKDYTYRITSPEVGAKEYKFKTIPVKLDKFQFVVYGDTRTKPKRHRSVVEQIIKTKPLFVVVSGDLVSKGSIYEQWDSQFFGPIKGLGESTPIYATQGNHDLSKQKYFERLFVPKGESNNFAFEVGPLYYYCLDNFASNMDKWLDILTKNVKASDSVWKFASYHIPSLNVGGHSSAWGYPRALPAVSKAGVDFVVTGHSHVYERFLPVAPLKGSQGSYVTHITSGGGGAPNYKIAKSDILAKTLNCLHFCLFEIDGNKLTMKVIDDKGAIIDRLEISKSNGRVNDEYISTAISIEKAHAAIEEIKNKKKNKWKNKKKNKKKK